MEYDDKLMISCLQDELKFYKRPRCCEHCERNVPDSEVKTDGQGRDYHDVGGCGYGLIPGFYDG